MYLDHITDDELADVAALLENSTRLGLEVMRLTRAYREKRVGADELLEAIETYRRETPFFYKGDITDLSYFWQGKSLHLASLDSLPHELQETVKKNFELLEKQGFIAVQNGVATLTDSGERMVFSSNFLTETVKADMDKRQEIANGIAAEMERRADDRRTEPVKTSEELQHKIQAIAAKSQEQPEIALAELKELNVALEQSKGRLSPELQIKTQEVDTAVRNIVLDGRPLPETLKELQKKWEKPEVEINFRDLTLRTENEIVREAVQDAVEREALKQGAEQLAQKGIETAAKSAGAVGTAGVSLAVEVGQKILAAGAKEFVERVIK